MGLKRVRLIGNPNFSRWLEIQVEYREYPRPTVPTHQTSKKNLHPATITILRLYYRDFSYGYAGNKKTFEKALTLRGSFENSAAKIIKARQGMRERAKADVLSSFSQDMYRDPSAVRTGVLRYSPGDFREAFDAFARDGSISIHDVEDLVKHVMGIDVPQWILSKFDKLGRSVAQYKMITWNQFRWDGIYPFTFTLLLCHVMFLTILLSSLSELIPLAQEICDVECGLKNAAIPPHLRPQTAPERSGLVPYHNPSSYMIDYHASRLQDPVTIGQPSKKSGTTRDLFVGTTRATEQLPAYRGHIPHNVTNHRKYEHSQGLNPRPAPCYLRLVSERLGSVPNYTGDVDALQVTKYI